MSRPKKNSNFTEDDIRSMVKSVLVQSTVLKEAISETNFTGPRISHQSEDILVPATNTMEELINVEFINILTGKIAEHLLCNAEFQEALTFNIEHQVRGCTDKLKKKIDDLEVKLTEADDQLEQYSRRNGLVIHGILSTKNENCDDLAKKFFSQHLGVNLHDTPIDRSHRIQRSEGKYRSQKSSDNCPETKDAHSVHKKRPPPIIVKFTRHNVKTMIYNLKKKLAGKPFLITESLTQPRKKCIKQLQELRKKKSSSSFGGASLPRQMEGPRPRVYPFTTMATKLLGSDADCKGLQPASCFVIQNH